MRRGFTLIELIIVVAILGIAGAMVIPSMTQIHVLRVQAAVRTLVSDITFAQADAIAFQERRAIVFDVTGNSYRIVAVPGATVDPDNNTLFLGGGPSGRYVVNFDRPDYAGAKITEADFAGLTTLIFDDLGSPAAFTTGDQPGLGGAVTIFGSDQTFKVVVEPYTGRVTVRKLDVVVIHPIE